MEITTHFANCDKAPCSFFQKQASMKCNRMFPRHPLFRHVTMICCIIHCLDPWLQLKPIGTSGGGTWTSLWKHKLENSLGNYLGELSWGIVFESSLWKRSFRTILTALSDTCPWSSVWTLPCEQSNTFGNPLWELSLRTIFADSCLSWMIGARYRFTTKA